MMYLRRTMGWVDGWLALVITFRRLFRLQSLMQSKNVSSRVLCSRSQRFVFYNEMFS